MKTLTNKLVLSSNLVILALLLATSFFPLPRPAADSSLSTQQHSTLGGQAGNATYQVVTNITVSPSFTLLNTNELSQISVLISELQLPTNSPATTLTVVTSFDPSIINGNATLANSTQVKLIPGSLNTGTLSAKSFTISIPPNATSAIIVVEADGVGQDILGKFATVLPFVSVQSSLFFVPSMNVLVPRGDIISQTYGGYAASEIEGSVLEPNPTPTTAGAPVGEWLYAIPLSDSTIIVQPSWFGLASLLLIVLASAAVALATVGSFERGRVFLNRLLARVTQLLNGMYHSIASIVHLQVQRPKNGWLNSFLLDSKKFLVLFLACGMLMISIAALAGPDPTFKAYVIAAPAEIPGIQSQLQSLVHGSVQIITPSQDYNDFEVMSNVGTFNMVVVSQYSSLELQTVGGSVLPYFGNVPIIVVDSSADPVFATQIRALYQVINVTNNNLNTPNVGIAVTLNQRHNILGLAISGEGFKEILAIEGGLSFLLFFLGALFFGVKIAEPSNNSSDGKPLYRLVWVAVYGIFLFYFVEVVYVVTSSTLAFPLSLHAVVSGATSITAVGLFGRVVHLPLGGGTTPRLISGALGFFIGAFAMGSSRLFNKYVLALIVGVFAILLLNPFYVGVLIYQVILLFVGSISTGFVAASALSFKGFLYGFGSGLGGDISSANILSAGKILYFASLAPLAFIKKMGKTTASLTLLLASLAVGDGGVRSGEMTPDKTVVAVFPGLIAGLAFTAVLLLISLVEVYVTANYTRSRP